MSVSKPYLLGIDLGTSDLKSVVFDKSGREIAISYRTPELIRPHPNWQEVDMERIWAAVKETVGEVVANPETQEGEIIAIGITGVCCGSWLVDEDVRPVRNAILWNDGRAVDIVAEWSRSGRMDEIFEISGNIAFPGYTVAVLRWLAENEPESLERARYSIYCKDFIRYKLTGNLAVDRSDMAYLPWDIRQGEISEELLQLCGISGARRLFPDMIPSEAIAGTLQPGLAAELGLPAGIPVVGGLVDVAATTLGAGAWRPGLACSIIGTSNLNSVVSDQPSFEPFGIGVQTESVQGTFVRSLANTSGTIGLQWFLDQFCSAEEATARAAGQSIYAWAEKEASKIALGSEGVIYHPYINTTGVISPFFHPAARSQFFGISIEHTRAHLLRAVYEGTALSMADCYEQMPIQVDQIYVSGGGARSPFWCQMMADCTGKTLLVTRGTELGARGVVILAGIASGLYQDLEEAQRTVVHIHREYKPDPNAYDMYRKVYEVYRQVYQSLSEAWWSRHRMLQELRS